MAFTYTLHQWQPENRPAFPRAFPCIHAASSLLSPDIADSQASENMLHYNARRSPAFASVLLAASRTEFGGVAGSRESREEARYPTVSRRPSAAAGCDLLAVQRGPPIRDCGWTPGTHLLVLRRGELLGAAKEYRRCLLCELRYFPPPCPLTWLE